MSRSRSVIWAGIAGVVLGVLAVLAVERADVMTSTEAFCATTCHSMEAHVANEQTYQESAHRTAFSGVHASCADCHIAKGLVAATWDHVTAGIKDIYSELTHDFKDPQAWEALRPRLAYGVRDRLLRTDSANCRSCHDESGIEPGFTRGKREHERAKNERITCIACHYNLVHRKVRPRAAFLERSRGLSPRERRLIEEQKQGSARGG